MRILHLSDLHLPLDVAPSSAWHGGWRCAMAQIELRLLRRAVKFERARRVMERLVHDAERLAVDHVIVSGDLTTLALDEEFAIVRDTLGKLAGRPERLTLVPGNHDRYTPESFRERRFERHFFEHLHNDLPEYSLGGSVFPFARFVGERLAIIGLDSALVPAFPGLAYGRIGRRQLALLRAMLGDLRLRGRAVLVVTHHAPYGVDGSVEGRGRGLWDAPELLATCREHGVAALLHGHVHYRFHKICPGSGVSIFGGGSSTQLGREGYWVYEMGREGISSAESIDISGQEIILPDVTVLGAS